MFSVEQLLANDTWDRMQLITADLRRVEPFPVTYAFPHSRVALGCRSGEFVSSTITVGCQTITWWSTEMRLAYNTLISVISGAIAEHHLFPRSRCPVLPREVTEMFHLSTTTEVLPLQLFNGGALGGHHAYTFDGHAALCMWLTDSVSFLGVTRAESFRCLRFALNALTSIWSLAAAQNAATRVTSEHVIDITNRGE